MDEAFILVALQYGFDRMDVDNMQDMRFAECNNNKSAIGSDRKHIVDKMLEDEIALGHYRIVSKRPRIINTLGAVEKPGTSDLRLIMDASRPVGRSLNSYADPEHFSLETVDNAVSMLNRGWYQAKIDLKNGYRSVGISERNYECTGIKWKVFFPQWQQNSVKLHKTSNFTIFSF